MNVSPLRTTGSARCYRVPPDLVVRIELPDRESLFPALEEFLLAHFPRGAPGGGAEEELWQLELAAKGEGAGRFEDALGPASDFVAESGPRPVRARIVEVAPGEHWAWYPESQVLERWLPALRRVEIVAGAGSEDYLVVQALYAAVRSIEHAALTTRGRSTLVHGGAVAFHEDGALLLGEKGSGKTTLTTALLFEGASYVASDRAILWEEPTDEERACWLAGWLCTYRLEPETLELLLSGTELGRARERLHRFARERHFEKLGKYRFPPAAFLEIGPWNARGRARLSCVVELRPDPGPVRFEELAPGAASELLASHRVERRLLPFLGSESSYAAPGPIDGIRVIRLRGREEPRALARRLRDRLARKPA